MSVTTLLMVLAVICFALAALGLSIPRLNLVALGLAFGFGAFLAGGRP